MLCKIYKYAKVFSLSKQVSVKLVPTAAVDDTKIKKNRD